ncbi:MAG: hypothetical protein A3G87_08425 [Omnitrophica bacterium RIFCSPLOWO2_12_FULL_50_11]|nr:MAG: hypothetical protein A3G87_08425 [Omnitrophica bacterium RIFCSPLOWO2_12_FULL_50_11]
MLNAVCAAAMRQTGSDGISRLNFMINRMTPHNLSVDLEQGETRAAAAQPPVATLSFEANDQSWHGTLAEESGEPVCRYPYDEESIIALCRIDQSGRSISLEGETDFTPIEVVVAMTKALHQALYPDAPGKWVFCRWESEHWPITIPASGLSVMLSKTLGSRLTKSAVAVGGERIGWVYFSARVEP